MLTSEFCINNIIFIIVSQDDPTEPENLDEFVSAWLPQLLTQAIDSNLASRYVWPAEEKPVYLKRLDVYQCDNPLCQQSSSNLAESRRIRWGNYDTDGHLIF